MNKKVTGLVLAGLMAGCLTGCKPKEPVTPDFDLEYADGTCLRIAGGYQKSNEAISFQDASITGEGVTLADGKTYHTGDLKPTWVFVGEKLKLTFEDKFTGAGSAEKEFKVWENQLDQVDIVAGNADSLVAAGSEGKLIDLNEHINDMPHFKQYLEENQIARLSITGNTETGAMYFSPYFDGVDDIERMPLIRADMVKALLDGDEEYHGANRALAAYKYTPYMPTTGKVAVKSLKDATGATQTITKDYSKHGNIIATMNGASGLKGDNAVKLFRAYIDEMYGKTFAKRSDLFLGYNACWDADEMVALLRCAVASLDDNDGNPISGLFSRETGNLQRNVDMFRFAGSLFGVRGMESRKDYLYFDSEGVLHDARQEPATYEAVTRMNWLVQEGLLITEGTATSTNYLEKDAGLMSYDYNQTQTVMNGTKLQNADGEEYIAIMVPVAKWNDGKKEEYKRFTESWRSVKTDGWAISAAGVANNPDKLNAALALIDFAFSVQGQITMSYGSDDFIKVKDATVEVKTWADVEKKYETFNFNGTQMPVITDATYQSLQDLAGGNYTNFARRYLGSTLNGFPKSQAFEYQCTHEVGKKGSAVLATAIGAGIIEHPVLEINAENMWYTSIPTTLPTTAQQTAALKELTDLSTNFSSSKGGKSVLYNIICTGDTGVEGFGVGTAADRAAYVANTWHGGDYLDIVNAQWSQLQAFYNTL